MRNNAICEIKSPRILQPGRAALTDWLAALCDIVPSTYSDVSVSTAAAP